MEKQVPGILLTTPDRTRFDQVLDVFVDDVHGGLTTDGIQQFTSQPPTAIPKCSNIHAQTYANLQFYSQLLFTTGGKLALHKCYVYILRTIWKQGRRAFEATNATLPPIRIKQSFGQEVHDIKIISPDDAGYYYHTHR